MKHPVVGITGNLCIVDNDEHFNGMKRSFTNQDYIDFVANSDAIPIILPVLPSSFTLTEELIQKVDVILLSGGYDISPSLYQEDALPVFNYSIKIIDLFYLNIIHLADKYKKPLFGICKGMQAMNVAYGGTLYQDLDSQINHCLQHRQNAFYQDETHKVHLRENSFLYSCFKQTDILCNSYHHQAIKKVANDFHVVATASDGVIEGIERTAGVPMVGVQWHPEMLASGGNLAHQNLFSSFLNLVY